MLNHLSRRGKTKPMLLASAACTLTCILFTLASVKDNSALGRRNEFLFEFLQVLTGASAVLTFELSGQYLAELQRKARYQGNFEYNNLTQISQIFKQDNNRQEKQANQTEKPVRLLSSENLSGIQDRPRFSTLRTKITDAEILKSSLRDLGISVKTEADVRGYNGERVRADVVAILEGEYDIGWSRNADGSFDLIACLWGINKKHNQTELINSIIQKYTVNKTLAEVKRPGLQNANVKLVLQSDPATPSATENKRNSAKFKAMVAIEALKGHKTVNEIASDYGLDPAEVQQWRQAALDGVHSIFSSHHSQNLEKTGGLDR